MNELRYWEKISKNKPILLLDDIFSELDIDNQKVVLSLINQYQTVATTTDKLLIKLVDFPDKATDHTIDL
jgi:DNA replication and repair protein RecF